MKLLFVARHVPASQWTARELMDMAMVAATFDQQVSLLFLGDGVLQLALQQAANPYQDVHETFDMFKMLGVDHCYAEQDALQHYQLNMQHLALETKAVEPEAIRQLFEQADRVIML